MKKNIYRIIPILLLVVTILNFSSVLFADTLSGIFDPDNIPGRDENNTITNIDNSVLGIWSTVILILQLASVGAFIFAGVKYMFSSADTRANIKTQMVWLIIGSIFVFASSTVVNFIVKSAKEILK